jgi:hypothetical protein
VLLPCWLAEKGDSAGFDWLLRHELMHWRHRDPLALAVRRLAEMLFYFHLVVWWTGKKWEAAMELACDRALLNEESDALSYAEQLYRILEGQHARFRRPLTAGLFATRSQIGRRIEALLANPLRFPARLSAMSMTGLLMVALIAFTTGFGILSSSLDEPEQDAETSVMAQDLEHFKAPVHLMAAGKPIDTERVGHAAPDYVDFDGDGVKDLLVGEFYKGRMRIYHNYGTNTAPRFENYEWFMAGGELATVPPD